MDATGPCPRCGGRFRCEAEAGESAPCDCFAVQVPEAARRLLRERYTGCVCLSCLREVARQAGPATAPPEATQPDLTPPGPPGTR